MRRRYGNNLILSYNFIVNFTLVYRDAEFVQKGRKDKSNTFSDNFTRLLHILLISIL